MSGTTYSGTADAMTRAALQAAVALPTDLTQTGKIQLAKTTIDSSAASTTADMTTAAMISANLRNNMNLVATINDGVNANKYITTLITKERNRLDGANSTVRNEQFKLNSKLLSYEYLLNYYTTGKAMAIFSLYIAIIMLVVAALWRAGVLSIFPFVFIVGISIALYSIVIISASALVSSRKKTSWQQRRWAVTNQSSINTATF